MRKSLNKLLLSVVVMLSVNCLAGSGGDDSGRTPSSRKNANTVNGLFYLIDYQTQTPVVRCRVPGGWFAGGKATWSQNPAQPVTWYVWIMSPESEIKTAVASPCVIGMPGTIRQVPLLHDPRILANNFLPAVQKDYNLSGVVLIESCFRDVGDAEKNQLLAARRRQSAQRGIQLTGCFLREFFARYEGEGGGKRRTVILSIPVMALESRISLSQVVTVEFLSLFSFCCRKGDELKAQICLEEMIKSVQPNPNFIALVNRISNQRTASWVSAQIQIRNQQMCGLNTSVLSIPYPTRTPAKRCLSTAVMIMHGSTPTMRSSIAIPDSTPQIHPPRYSIPTAMHFSTADRGPG